MTRTRYPREWGDNMTGVSARSDQGSWYVITTIAERESTTKINVIREALRMLCNQRHPDLADKIADPNPARRLILALQAEVEQLRAQLKNPP